MTRPPFAAALLASVAAALSPQLAHAARVLGVDVSSYQGKPTAANWSAAQASGIGFAFIKATEGKNTIDSSFASNVTNLRTTGVLFGAYHFADPYLQGHETTTAAVAEADNFVLNGASAMKAGNLMPVLDYEKQLYTGTGAAPDTNIAGWLLAFSNEVYAKTGLLPTIYCNVSDAQTLSSVGTSAQKTAIASQNLWEARYYDYSTTTALNEAETNTGPATSNQYGPWTGTINAQGPAKPWDFWQYTDRGSVTGIGSTDMDVANGDINFVQKFKISAIFQSDASANYGSTVWNTVTAGPPTATDRVIINRPSANPLVTVTGSAKFAQSLDLGDQLAVTDNSLTITEYANLNGNTTVSGGTFSVGTTIANTATLTVSGGSLIVGSTLTNASTLAISSGSASAQSLVNNASVTLSGGATTINNAITGTGTIVTSGGTLNAISINQASLTMTGGTVTASASLATTGAINVGSGGTLNVGSIASGTLALVGTGTTKFTGTSGSKVTGLSIANTATLNLSLGKLADDYTGATPADALRQAALAGALRSDKAIAGMTGVGFAEATKVFGAFTGTRSWNAQNVDNTTQLVSLALFGDTNLDNTVNLVDLTTLAADYGKPGLWQDGDSTYDGVVDNADLALLGLNFGRTLNADGTVTANDPAGFAAALAGFPNLVPEPTSLATLALAGTLMMRRRRAV